MIENKKYKNNYLKLVIFRIDFSPLLNLAKEILNPNLQKDFIAINFKDLTEHKLVEFETKFERGVKTDKFKSISLWKFIDNEKHHQVSICENYLIIENLKYLGYDNYKDIVMQIFNIFSKYYEPNINRFGLRYINEINLETGNPFDWSDYINESLIFSLNNFFGSKQSDLCRYFGRYEMNKDDFMLTMQYGIVNSIFPNKIAKKEFVLDYDCHTKDVENKDELYKKLDLFHNEINYFFEKSITNGLRKKMGEI